MKKGPRCPVCGSVNIKECAEENPAKKAGEADKRESILGLMLLVAGPSGNAGTATGSLHHPMNSQNKRQPWTANLYFLPGDCVSRD